MLYKQSDKEAIGKSCLPYILCPCILFYPYRQYKCKMSHDKDFQEYDTIKIFVLLSQHGIVKLEFPSS